MCNYNLHIFQFIDSVRFVARSLSNLVINLANGIPKIKCKNELDNKKCGAWKINTKNCECCLEYTNIKNNLILCKCLYCNKYYPNILMKF